jgi:polyisoprenoid-binding protein YceI
MAHRKLTIYVLALLALPAFSYSSQDFRIEPGWSHVEFEVKNFGFHTVEGRFKSYAGAISYDPLDVTKSSVTVTIQAASIDTGIKKRDDHLRSKDFFEADKYPDMTFQSSSIVKKGDRYIMTGPLTIKAHTHPVELTFTFTSDTSADDKPMLHAEATGVINRHDFDIDYGSNFSVGKQVRIFIHIQALP